MTVEPPVEPPVEPLSSPCVCAPLIPPEWATQPPSSLGLAGGWLPLWPLFLQGRDTQPMFQVEHAESRTLPDVFKRGRARAHCR